MFQIGAHGFRLNGAIRHCRRPISISCGFASPNEEWAYWHHKKVMVGAGQKTRKVSQKEHSAPQFDDEQFGKLIPEKKLSPQHKHNVDSQLNFGPVIVSKSMEKRNKGKTLVAKQNIAAEENENSSEFYWMSNVKTEPSSKESDKERVTLKTIGIEDNSKPSKEQIEPNQYTDHTEIKLEETNVNTKPLENPKVTIKPLEGTKVTIKLKDNPVQNPERTFPRCELTGDFLQIPLDRTNGLPSVTKILKATMSENSKMVLARWEERMIEKLGEDGFAILKAKTFERGHVLHKHVEDYMTTGEIMEHQDITDHVSKNHFMSITSVMKDFSDPFALESAVVHPTLGYHGILDCVAKYKDTTVLIDWKTSERIKPSLASLFDNPLQVAAYIGAVNYDKNYESAGSISGGAVVVVYNTGYPAQVHTLQEKDLQKAWRAWLKRLSLYKQMVLRGEIKQKEIKTGL